VVIAAREQAIPISCIQKISDKEDDRPSLRFTTDNAAFLDALSSDCRVGGGTAWFWARPDASGSVDVLFIDEAAQMSLANVLAVSQAAQSIVLLGDPRQLEQPIQGSHPDGVAVSSLDHILGTHATVPADRGLFLAETWRLHPLICAFNSELFYEGRLHPRPGLENQTIRSDGRIAGAGLRYLPVEHQGNQSSSREEAEKIRDLVSEILADGTTWVNRDGAEAGVETMLAELQPLIDKVWRHCEVKGTRGRTVTLKVKFADFELISRSRTVAGAMGSRDELECASAELLRALFPFEKAVRLLGISISGFELGETQEPEQIALEL
jgi:hypothetical protein